VVFVLVFVFVVLVFLGFHLHVEAESQLVALDVEYFDVVVFVEFGVLQHVDHVEHDVLLQERLF